MPKLPVKLLFFLYCGLCAGMPTQAADSAENQRIALRILYQDDLCGGNRPTSSLTLVAGADQLERILSAVNGRKLGPSPPAPVVDFDAEYVVYIQMGQKPSGGHGLELADPYARIDDGTALFRLRWIEPEPGAIVTQVLTNPCLIVALPKGAYRWIVITDESGNVREKFAVP